ncbi:unnamed protein product [Orchesella dallaii]|uniref:Uncharacterized protein n=1 Tax=Orchesella dallaii TaxID=48710 RepID=A0ABP1S804_9HEXA
MPQSSERCLLVPVLFSCFTFIFIGVPVYIIQPILDSKTDWNVFGIIFSFLVGVPIVLIVIIKYFYSKYRNLQEIRKKGEDWVSEHPMVIVSTVSHDYKIIISPSSSSSSVSPPKYEPPPAYNECVNNMTV